MIGFEDVMYYEINKHYVEVKLETYKGGTNLLWPMSEWPAAPKDKITMEAEDRRYFLRSKKRLVEEKKLFKAG